MDGACDQTAVIAFLENPASYGGEVAAVERIDTHIAHVFLAGKRAYKLKRAVRLPFLDLPTLARREAVCRAELELNRRTAPEMYLGLAWLSARADGGVEFDGPGEVLDWVVVMRRFAQDQLLDHLARQGAFPATLPARLAEAVAAFHDAAEPAPDGADATEMRRLLAVNAKLFRSFVPEVFSGPAVEVLLARATETLEQLAPRFDARLDQGFVRHGHGDLHLANIHLDGERPVIFDALEFDPRLARADVLYDLAFLLMDLIHHGLAAEASQVLSRYLLLRDDFDALDLIGVYLSLRAQIRAHVSATTAGGAEPARDETLRETARSYLDLAARALHPPGPRLIAVGGLSGSGKSTLASVLAPDIGPPPGAVDLRSDEIRKHLFQVPPEAPLPPEAYASDVSARVYGLLRDQARRVLATGRPVIVDAVNDRADARAALAGIAAELAVPFTGFWLTAPDAILATRIEARRGDASDATIEVMRRQREGADIPADWHHLDASSEPEAVAARAKARLV